MGNYTCPCGPCDEVVSDGDYRCPKCGKDLVDYSSQSVDPDRAPDAR